MWICKVYQGDQYECAFATEKRYEYHIKRYLRRSSVESVPFYHIVLQTAPFPGLSIILAILAHNTAHFTGTFHWQNFVRR
jgi:hypothetical protein